MKKIIFVIPITILFILLSGTIKTYAATLNEIINDPLNSIVVISVNEEGTNGVVYSLYEQSDTLTYHDLNNSQYFTRTNGGNMTHWYTFNQFNPLNEPDRNMTGSSEGPPFNLMFDTIIIRGVAYNVPDNGHFFNSIEDYEHRNDPPPHEETWFEIWSNRVNDFLEDWLPWAVDLDHAFDDLTMWLFGMELDGDDVQYGNDVEFYEFPSPTPFPTQIPYQEQIVPDGNGGFTIQYIYNNPSGTPITATAPPPEPTYSIQITDSPQYDISGVPVPPADGLQDAIDAIDDNIDDYQEGFEAVQGSFSTLPIKWYFFFGVPAAILLIAGIIRSLLGG